MTFDHYPPPPPPPPPLKYLSCKEDEITSAQREWFIFIQLTSKQWIITQQFTAGADLFRF